jgi:hypothetical protein
VKIAKDGRDIRSVDDWFTAAPPAGGARHWVDGRSAKELAKAWFPCGGEAQLPIEVRVLLDSSPQFRDANLEEAEPEARVRFDAIPGEPRNCDLLITGSSRGKRFVMSVEAKADESFGQLVSRELAACAERPSRLPERIDALARALFGCAADVCGELRYQLVHGAAAAISAAEQKGAYAAIVLVHEFVTDRTNDDRHAANAADLNAFVRKLSGDREKAIVPGQLVGPFNVPGNTHCPASIRLFVGKAVRNTRRVV